jgi:hypothetical protein
MLDCERPALGPIAGVSWSARGNCILLTRGNTSAQEILPLIQPFQTELETALTTTTCPIKQICEDKPWSRIVLDGIDTHHGAWLPYDGPDRLITGDEILNELWEHNPCLEGVILRETPRWLCDPDTLQTKRHSSVVLTLESEEDHRRIFNQ